MFEDFLYSLGAHICHQMPERSFFIAGNQVFVASRDTGVYLGFLIAISVILLLREMENKKENFRLILALIVPIAIDGLGVTFGFWESSNSTRLYTGLLGGIGMAYLIAYGYPYKRRDGLLPGPAGLGVSLFGALLAYFSLFFIVPRFFDNELAFNIVQLSVFAGLASAVLSVGWLFRILLNRRGA